MMGGKMIGSTQFNPAIIGRRANPDGLPADECIGLPDPNMAPVLDIVGGLFKRQILDSPKDVEITHWCSRVASMSKAISSDFCRCLWGNRIRKQPAGLLEAVHDLIFRPDKDQIYRVSCCPGSGVGYFWIGGKIISVGVKTDNGNECCEKHQQDTYNTDRSDDRFSHTSRLIGRVPNCWTDRHLPGCSALLPEQLQFLFHVLAAHLRVPDRG